MELQPDDGAIATAVKKWPQDESPLRWEPLVLTDEKVRFIWDQLQQFPLVFDDFSKGRYDDFVAKFFVPNNVFIDVGPGVGLAAGFAVKPGLDAVLHLVMFDRRLRGRESTFKEIMAYFFQRLQLHRMTAMIADDARTAVKLVERLGFKLEGTMRGALLREGRYIDQHIYGILREEM